MEAQSENDKTIDEMLSLYFSNLEISNLISNKIPNPIQFTKYVLINKNWLDQYKLSCKYSGFESLIKFNYKNLKEMEIRKKLEGTKVEYEERKESLRLVELIRPDYFSKESIKCPKNFVFVKEGFFEKLLKNIPEENKENFKECYIK